MDMRKRWVFETFQYFTFKGQVLSFVCNWIIDLFQYIEFVACATITHEIDGAKPSRCQQPLNNKTISILSLDRCPFRQCHQFLWHTTPHTLKNKVKLVYYGH